MTGARLPVGGSEVGVARAEGFLALYEREFTPMLRLAFVTLGSNDTAEDVVQDAFVEVYRRWNDVREPGAYVRRAVLNRCISVLRRRRVERRHAASTRLHEMQWHDSDSLAISGALQKLSPRQRAAVHMRFVEGLSEAAIAETLGCRPGTVKSLLARSRSTMRKAIEHDN